MPYLAEKRCVASLFVSRNKCRSWQPSLSMKAGHPGNKNLPPVPTFSFCRIAIGPKITGDSCEVISMGWLLARCRSRLLPSSCGP